MMVQVNLLHWYVIEFRLIDQENEWFSTSNKIKLYFTSIIIEMSLIADAETKTNSEPN